MPDDFFGCVKPQALMMKSLNGVQIIRNFAPTGNNAGSFQFFNQACLRLLN